MKALFCLWFLCGYWALLWGQYPHYFAYDDEAGLPSNEVYSLAQDAQGFVWIGCDAGLYKFDGVGYKAYKSPSQKIKSVTGLTLSASGRLYCYNFQWQVFCIENDSLKALPNYNFAKITGIASDTLGNIFVSHIRGLSMYNETTGRWTDYALQEEDEIIEGDVSCTISQGSQLSSIRFLTATRSGRVEATKIVDTIACRGFFMPTGTFVPSRWRHGDYIFGTYNSSVYTIGRDTWIVPMSHTRLWKYLEGKKVTNARTLADGNLWICTYSGVVRYMPLLDSVDVFYPDLSFSDCLIDREGNYWFSTLQAGMIRVPDLNWRVWNRDSEQMSSERLTKIAASKGRVYFASVDGVLGSLDIADTQLKVFHTGTNADPQSFDIDTDAGCLYVNINKRLHCLRDTTLTEQPNEFLSIKSLKTVDGVYIIATSFGTFIGEALTKEATRKVDARWSRAVVVDTARMNVWVVSNGGLLRLGRLEGEWALRRVFFEDRQMLAAHLDEATGGVYCIGSDGSLVLIDDNEQIHRIAQLPQGILTYKLIKYRQKIYVATNAGLWIFDLTEQKWTILDKLAGIASNNIQDLAIAEGCLWLATGKGLQKIPLADMREKPLAHIFLHKITIGGNAVHGSHDLRVDYFQRLHLYPETAIYSSNGNFKYAYRIKDSDDDRWHVLPALQEGISVANLPYGAFEIELKAIDHMGRDSENTLLISGYAAPPFWKSTWFYALLLVAGVGVCIGVSWAIVRNIRNKELLKTHLINSQLQATQAQIKAIRAQMNPHFMYNALNSIQALILKQDIKNSNLYLSKFSNLLRKVLEASSSEEISLQEDIDILNLYLSLEKLRFGDDFQYEIRLDDSVDAYAHAVPPLLLQPFVENALKHGLLHKKGKKLLTIDYRADDKHLFCSVEDNGIGRQNAQKIRDKRPDAHRSFSTEASAQQVELLSAFAKMPYSIHIHDLHDEATNEAAGTRVVVAIPIFP